MWTHADFCPEVGREKVGVFGTVSATSALPTSAANGLWQLQSHKITPQMCRHMFLTTKKSCLRLSPLWVPCDVHHPPRKIHELRLPLKPWGNGVAKLTACRDRWLLLSVWVHRESYSPLSKKLRSTTAQTPVSVCYALGDLLLCPFPSEHNPGLITLITPLYWAWLG